MISADLMGCSTARNKGTCDNRKSVQRERLEPRVLNALRYNLMDPALFKEFCDEFTREMNRLRMEGSASIEAARSEIKRIERELDTLLNLILNGGAADKINSKMVQLESRKAEVEQVLADAEEPPPLQHPEMTTFYRERVSALHEALKADTEATRLKAGEVLRSLVKEIILTPGGGQLKIDVRGDLAGILAVALKTKTPATRAGVSIGGQILHAETQPGFRNLRSSGYKPPEVRVSESQSRRHAGSRQMGSFVCLAASVCATAVHSCFHRTFIRCFKPCASEMKDLRTFPSVSRAHYASKTPDARRTVAWPCAQIVASILRTLRELADGGLAVLLVEQLAMLALETADDAHVLQRGHVRTGQGGKSQSSDD